MNKDRTFWECVYDARREGLIPRVWRTGELIVLLTAPVGRFSPSTVSVDPYNYSVSREGNAIGYFVKRGEEPKAWRVARGEFQLIVDPEDDTYRQNTQRELAKKRAGELVAQIRLAGRHQTGQRVQRGSQTATQTSTSPTGVRHARTPGSYKSASIALDDLDRRNMAKLSTEQKALHIVEKHIRDQYGDRAEIKEDRDGVDLRVEVDGQTVERIEVKGTKSKDIAWSQLKVSSQKSHDALKGGAPMYRVVDVDGTQPRIYVLTYGRDFTLEPEARWAVRPTMLENDRYPLRGRHYRYDLPYDPVAQDDWETLE